MSLSDVDAAGKTSTFKDLIITDPNRGGGGGEKFQTHVRWLRDSHFCRDLEEDNIDQTIIDEELDTLRTEDIPLTRRQQLVRFLRSHPVQTFLCAIVLLDACIVIVQILLDINSVKDRLNQRDSDLTTLVNLLQRDVTKTGSQPNHTENDVSQHSQAKSTIASEPHKTGSSAAASMNALGRNCSSILSCTTPRRPKIDHVENRQSSDRFKPIPALWSSTGDDDTDVDDEALQRTSAQSDGLVINMRLNDVTNVQTHYYANESTAPYFNYGQQTSQQVDLFRQVAHSLHYVSIAILGILLVEDLVRIVALGKYICRHKIEILDTLVIATSFAVDIVFVGGITGDHGQKIAAALFVLLVWRVARVVDGIIVTIKQRQEFRIRLQRRARRKAEKQLDAAENERLQRIRELQTLQELCLRAGIKPENIAAICSNGKSPKRLSRMLHAFSSVARLSFGMAMPYSRPSSAFSSRRQSRHLSRHPSDGFLHAARRNSTYSSPTRSPPDQQLIRDRAHSSPVPSVSGRSLDQQTTGGERLQTGRRSSSSAGSSPVGRERSNSDGTGTSNFLFVRFDRRRHDGCQGGLQPASKQCANLTSVESAGTSAILDKLRMVEKRIATAAAAAKAAGSLSSSTESMGGGTNDRGAGQWELGQGQQTKRSSRSSNEDEMKANSIVEIDGTGQTNANIVPNVSSADVVTAAPEVAAAASSSESVNSHLFICV